MSDNRTRLLYFLAFFFVGCVLRPSFAHLLELPNKISLERDTYFIVQSIYRGWALLGIPVLGALLSTLTLSVGLRGQRRARRWSAVALIAIVVTQVIFWTLTFPANTATENWTRAPADWETLRTQWEYSHATAAVLNMAALLALVASVLCWRSGPDDLPRAH